MYSAKPGPFQTRKERGKDNHAHILFFSVDVFFRFLYFLVSRSSISTRYSTVDGNQSVEIFPLSLTERFSFFNSTLGLNGCLIFFVLPIFGPNAHGCLHTMRG